MEAKAEFNSKTTEVTLKHIQIQPLLDSIQLSCEKAQRAKDAIEIKEYIKLIEHLTKDLRSLTGTKEISEERIRELLGTEPMPREHGEPSYPYRMIVMNPELTYIKGK